MDLAFKHCDKFAFIRHSQLFYHQTMDFLLAELQEKFIESKEQTEWPGTISVPPATVYYSRTMDNAREIIQKAYESFFDWKAPYLPDDLCFFRNGKEWLINTAHEIFCAIKTDEEEIINKIKELEGANAMKDIERKFNNEVIETINTVNSNAVEKFKEIILANE